MSAAAEAIAETVPVRAIGKKKRLIISIGVALAVLLAGGGGAAFWLMKKRAAAAEAAADDDAAGEDEKHAEEALPKADLKHAPTFVPLDPFTVNLADRDAERYAQVGITLELADAKAGDLLKAYMPAIRNNILLALAAKTAGQLIEHEGKLQLALEIRAAALRPLGYRVEVPAAPVVTKAVADDKAAADDPAHEETAKPASRPAKKAKPAHDSDEDVPIRAVHFSNFIIQ